MTQRKRSRHDAVQLARLVDLARLRARVLEHRLATEGKHAQDLRARIDAVARRRAALLACRTGEPDPADGADATPPRLSAYMLARAVALRTEQAVLYRDLARAEAALTPLRIEARRAQARSSILDKMARRT
jgi:hypothetical protein